MNQNTIFQNGRIYDASILNEKFEVGTKFKYTSVSYNDIFVVSSHKVEIGLTLVCIVGNIMGEVWTPLISLQRDFADGNITKIEEPSKSNTKKKVSNKSIKKKQKVKNQQKKTKK